MATIRYEWVTIGVSPHFDMSAPNILSRTFGTPGVLAVTATATLAGSRPTMPSAPEKITRKESSVHYARIAAIDGNSIVAWGDDPTAAQNNGILIMAGYVELIPVRPGQLLSFVELV